MMTVNRVSRLSGVSIRTLHHYDSIGLLIPAEVSEAGYRLYDDASLTRLQDILMLRELEFSLEDIKKILDAPDYDRKRALEQQIRMLELKKEHLDGLINHAREMLATGGNKVNFKAFDKEKMDEYAKKAKEAWGGTGAYREYEEKAKDRSPEETGKMGMDMMDIFREFGEIKEKAPDSSEAGVLVRKLQKYISDNFYTCTDEILMSLGTMYGAGGEYTDSIDSAGGNGTASFTAKAIEAALGKNRQ